MDFKSKCYEISVEEGDINRISSLLDVIISDILCLIPTKCVVRTSVLSKSRGICFYNCCTCFTDTKAGCRCTWLHKYWAACISYKCSKTYVFPCKSTIFRRIHDMGFVILVEGSLSMSLVLITNSGQQNFYLFLDIISFYYVPVIL